MPSQVGEIRLVASDLDGTLLAPDKKLSALSIQTLQELHDTGKIFVYATGRHYLDVCEIGQVTGKPAFMVTSNGAQVHATCGTVVSQTLLDGDLVTPLLEMSQEHEGVVVNIYTITHWWSSVETEWMREHKQEFNMAPQFFEGGPVPTSDVLKVFFNQTEGNYDILVELEERIIERFGEQVHVCFSSPQCLEVMAKGVSKLFGLQQVAKAHDIELDECLAFGDGMNDVEMLGGVGRGVLMGGAHERVRRTVPQAERIGVCSEDAVAKYIQAAVLKK
ncbi:Cof-type HAD-IIB family hydrolase [Polycladidibacter stylochi]|uniref:Cof-type HAD-IIB family hydrolase n=1 Tax=Polycladidibacter stylochi TaxID=1807766 RepID=UPI000AF16402|nr:Cof-type HAD-IIB family hydrolase [Pseudovibrio stylochi]